jgi:hypothetical protein
MTWSLLEVLDLRAGLGDETRHAVSLGSLGFNPSPTIIYDGFFLVEIRLNAGLTLCQCLCIKELKPVLSQHFYSATYAYTSL